MSNMNTECSKPKWKRAFSPKVRTGCLTWIRRKKCDEEKPTCRRCRQDDRECDGYVAPDRKVAKGVVRILAQKQLSSVFKSLPATLTLGVTGTALERRYISHFFNRTIGDMATLPGPQDFWTCRLPRLSQDIPFIRHAVMALGASHWLYLSQGVATLEHAASLEGFLIQNYNRAISSVAPLMSSTSLADIRLVLVCCLLFILLENLRGAQSEAIRHLAAGARVIASLDLQGTEPDNLIRELATIFCRIGADVTLFTEHTLLPDLSGWAEPLQGNGDISQPFPSLSVAESTLEELNILFSQYWEECNGANGDECRPWELPGWKQLMTRFDDWSIRYHLTPKALLLESSSPQERYRAHLLELERRLWYVTFHDEMGEDSKRGPSRHLYYEILDQVELLQNLSTAAHPIFSLKADIVAAIILAYTFCPDADVRQRAVTLLRTQRRREIVWDSRDVAEFLEEDFKNRLTDADAPEWPEIGPSLEHGALLVLDAPRR